MPRFPMEYGVELHKNDGEPMHVTAAHRQSLIVGPPPDFGGADTWWSPEHLLVSALASCMATTFTALAERANLHVGSYRCRARGILDRVEGKIAFASMRLDIDVKVIADDVQRTRAVLDDAKSRCFVAASLRCPIEMVAEVKAS